MLIVAHGNVARACREAGVERGSFYWRINADPEFLDRYVRAKEMGMDALADEIVDIADTPQIGEIVTRTPKGVEVKTADMLGHRNLRIESRKWLLAKLKPKVYHDRFVVQNDPDHPIPPAIVIGVSSKAAEVASNEIVPDADGISET